MFAESVRSFTRCDAAVLTAAVCDYRPARRLRRKLKKHDVAKDVTLLPTRDIAAYLGKRKGRRVTICFAMEDHRGRERAEAKLRRKNCDAIVLNGPGNIGADSARIWVYQPARGWSAEIRGSKRDVARSVILLIESLVGDQSRRG